MDQNISHLCKKKFYGIDFKVLVEHFSNKLTINYGKLSVEIFYFQFVDSMSNYEKSFYIVK